MGAMNNQINIDRNELFTSQLELLMQNSRPAMFGLHIAGVVAAVLMFWYYVPSNMLLGWAVSLTTVLLLRNRYISGNLLQRDYLRNPRRTYWWLIFGAAVTGALWSAGFIFAAPMAPQSSQYAYLLLMMLILAFSLGVTVVVREYFLAYLITAMIPVAWWQLVHYWEYNNSPVIGAFLLVACGVMVLLTDRVYSSYRTMLTTIIEREAMSRELGELAQSLRDRNRQLRDMRQKLTDLANLDELTGLSNRRRINEKLGQEVSRARRTGTPLGVILVDVDYFKKYNDTYGHPAGDEVLKRVATAMKSCAGRAGEVAGRWGGEEFMLILPGSDRDALVRAAVRLQTMILDEAISHRTSELEEKVLTVSQGAVSLPPGSLDSVGPEEAVELADKALYASKARGRNQFVYTEIPAGAAASEG